MKRDLLFKYCTGPCFKEEALDQVVGRCFPQGLNNLKILDVGCRNGEWAHALHKGGAIVYGIDQCSHALNEARSRFPHLSDRFAQGKAQELSSCRLLQGITFDYIFCLGMLCYLTPLDQQKALDEMGKMLAAKGEVWASFPRALPWWQKIFVFLANKMPLILLRISAMFFAFFMQVLDFFFQVREGVYAKNYWPYWGPLGVVGLATDGPSFHQFLSELAVDLTPLCSPRSSHLFRYKSEVA